MDTPLSIAPQSHILRLASLVTRRSVGWLSLLALCSAFIQGGLTKAFAFDGAVAEMHRFDLEPAATFAAVAIVFELGASICVLIGFHRWLGAALLALFTLVATLIANRFWSVEGPGRLMAENGFFEHLGLVGGFLFVAWFDLNERLAKRHQAVAVSDSI